MIENENRNCNCMSNSTSQINTNINYPMQNSINNSNMSTCGCGESNQTRENMLEKIKCLNFAIIELGLYLDTHPNDEKALCLHRKYCKEYRERKKDSSCLYCTKYSKADQCTIRSVC